jgi:hypothetical protein
VLILLTRLREKDFPITFVPFDGVGHHISEAMSARKDRAERGVHVGRERKALIDVRACVAAPLAAGTW